MGKRLSDVEYAKIKKNIIKRLYAHKSFSKGHLLYERLTAAVPSHLAGFVGDVLDDLVKNRRADVRNHRFLSTLRNARHF